MIKNFADLSPVEPEVRVSEMYKRNSCDEDQHPGVVSLPLGFEGIVAQFIAVWSIVNIMFFFKTVTMRVGRENVLVTIKALHLFG